MSLAQVNKELRKELELLTIETRALSAVYWILLQFISDNQKNKIKSEARKFVRSSFTKEEIEAFYKRNADRVFRKALESDVLEIVSPQKTR